MAGIEFTADAVAKVSGTPLELVEEECERLARRRQFLRSAGLAAWVRAGRRRKEQESGRKLLAKGPAS